MKTSEKDLAQRTKELENATNEVSMLNKKLNDQSPIGSDIRETSDTKEQMKAKQAASEQKVGACTLVFLIFI